MAEICKEWGEVIFSYDHPDIKYTLERAVERGEDLSGAYLPWTDLVGAKLSRAYLLYANFGGSNLEGADLTGADLFGAELKRVNLKGANLQSSDLRYADLSGANLRGSDLSYANLTGANFSEADLTDIIYEGEVQTLEFLPLKPWSVLKSKKSIIIGCRKHSRESFDDEDIRDMGPGAIDFWRKHKHLILS